MKICWEYLLLISLGTHTNDKFLMVLKLFSNKDRLNVDNSVVQNFGSYLESRLTVRVFGMFRFTRKNTFLVVLFSMISTYS